MRLSCPCCGEQFPMEAGLADDEGKRLAALFAEFEPKLGRAVLQYLRLFSPAKQALLKPGTVTRDARTTDTRRAASALWVLGIEQMLASRETLTLPLDNHHYLRAVVWGLAGDAKAVAAAQATAPRSNTSAPANDYLERLARINGDEQLGFITAEEAAKRRSELV